MPVRHAGELERPLFDPWRGGSSRAGELARRQARPEAWSVIAACGLAACGQAGGPAGPGRVHSAHPTMS
jgi:hypothetical protein